METVILHLLSGAPPPPSSQAIYGIRARKMHIGKFSSGALGCIYVQHSIVDKELETEIII